MPGCKPGVVAAGPRDCVCRRKPWDSNPQATSTATCFQDRLLIRPDDFRLSVAGAGIEPTPGRSERPVLPLDEERINSKVRGAGLEPASPLFKARQPAVGRSPNTQSALRESDPPRQLGRLAPLPLGQGHKAAAAGIEPASGRLTAAFPYQHGNHRINKSGRLDLNQRSRAPEARGFPNFPTS